MAFRVAEEFDLTAGDDAVFCLLAEFGVVDETAGFTAVVVAVGLVVVLTRFGLDFWPGTTVFVAAAGWLGFASGGALTVFGGVTVFTGGTTEFCIGGVAVETGDGGLVGVARMTTGEIEPGDWGGFGGWTAAGVLRLDAGRQSVSTLQKVQSKLMA